ncbi:hypothetical protein [Neobacillus sp. D3-1R]|uniref:hypothetical protein n=1 Tax=Neobacillus sp. D3-1R TaxID=3445778 RepID=UPI003FA19655
MNQTEIHYMILFSAIFFNGLGCLYLLIKNFLGYRLVLLLSLLLSSFLCLVFYWLGFYRFVLPLWQVLPAVAISFSLLVLITIRFKPKRHTFPFFFMMITSIFTIEVLLKEYWGFIKFRNGWDFWDSYSLYWVYVRLFNYIGDRLVPRQYRMPIYTKSNIYWGLFILIVIYALFGVFYLAMRN